MNSLHDNQERERLVMAYIDAIEEGELTRVGELLAIAEQSPQLLAMIEEVNEALYAELEQQAPVSETALVALPEAVAFEEPSLDAPTKQDDHAPPSPSASRWALGACGIFGLGLLLFGFVDLPKNAPSGIALCTQGPAQQRKVPKNNMTWLQVVQQSPEKMLQMLTTEELHQDLKALHENQRLPEAVARPFAASLSSAAHRAVRVRLHLRMAQFHIKNYKLALSFHRAVYQRRLAQNEQGQALGHKFHLYWGRLLCLQGDRVGSSDALAHAASLAPDARQDRIKAWQLSCRPKPMSPQALTKALAQLTFAQDPDGWADWALIHQLRSLVPGRSFQPTTPRARLYANVLRKQPAHWPRHLRRTPVEYDRLGPSIHKARLSYYDPAVFLVMGRDYAQRAQKLLAHAPPNDRYAAFYNAEAHRLMGQQTQALRAYARFLRKPPHRVEGAYLFFSHRLSPRFLRNEACYRVALAPQTSHTQARQIFRGMAQYGGRGSALASLGLIERKLAPKQGFAALTKAIDFAPDEAKKAHMQLLLASVQAPTSHARRGAQIVAQFRLTRYQFRALYLWGSMGALLMKEETQATQWLEVLHRKRTPYKISGENAPLQFAWTARAYLGAGQPGVASLFLSKNLEAYPSLTQLWHLLRVWRTYEGLSGHQPIKG